MREEKRTTMFITALLAISLNALLLSREVYQLEIHNQKNLTASVRSGSVVEPQENTVFRNIFINAPSIGIYPSDGKADSISIENAFATAPDGATIFFPKGIYRIDRPILLKKSNIKILGEAGTSWRFDNTADYYARYGQVRVGMLNVCANNITIENIAFDQNFRATGRRIPAEPLIGGVIMGCKYTGVSIPTKDITVTNSRFYDYYGDALSVFNAPVEGFTARNNTFTSAYIVGRWTKADSSGVAHGEQAINVASGKNIIIESNTIYGALDDAIAVHTNISDLTIRGNIITTTGGRILIAGTTNALVEKNTITYIENGSSAIWLTFEPDATNLSLNSNVKVLNNTIVVNPGSTLSSAIRLYGPGNGIEIAGNIIQTSDKQGIGILLNSRIYNPTNKYHFDGTVIVQDNMIDNFKIGIQQNTGIKNNPSLFTYKNNTITRTDTPFKNLDF